jgi:hypothetical protein
METLRLPEGQDGAGESIPGMFGTQGVKCFAKQTKAENVLGIGRRPRRRRCTPAAAATVEEVEEKKEEEKGEEKGGEEKGEEEKGEEEKGEEEKGEEEEEKEEEEPRFIRRRSAWCRRNPRDLVLWYSRREELPDSTGTLAIFSASMLLTSMS